VSETKKEVSSAVQRIRKTGLRRRPPNEVRDLPMALARSGGRVRLLSTCLVHETDGTPPLLEGFVVGYDVRTSVRDAADERPVFRRERVAATFGTMEYPDKPPDVRVYGNSSLFLPGIRTIARVPSFLIADLSEEAIAFLGCSGSDVHVSLSCLYTDKYDKWKMDLAFFVAQVHHMLTCDPNILNYVADAMNHEAAVWFAKHRKILSLPLESPLDAPGATSPGASGDAQDTISSFPVEEVE